MQAGVIAAGTSGVGDKVWNILGQTYVPLHVTETSMSWHATFPPDTFVPPHIHPKQDEFIYMLEGTLTFWLDGKESEAKPGDLARLPKGEAHGIFNKSGSTAKCLFWVSPTGKLFDLFEAINDVPDPEEVVKLAAKNDVEFLPPPG